MKYKCQLALKTDYISIPENPNKQGYFVIRTKDALKGQCRFYLSKEQLIKLIIQLENIIGE